jgi:hypothetical protein
MLKKLLILITLTGCLLSCKDELEITPVEKEGDVLSNLRDHDRLVGKNSNARVADTTAIKRVLVSSFHSVEFFDFVMPFQFQEAGLIFYPDGTLIWIEFSGTYSGTWKIPNGTGYVSVVIDGPKGERILNLAVREEDSEGDNADDNIETIEVLTYEGDKFWIFDPLFKLFDDDNDDSTFPIDSVSIANSIWTEKSQTQFSNVKLRFGSGNRVSYSSDSVTAPITGKWNYINGSRYVINVDFQNGDRIFGIINPLQVGRRMNVIEYIRGRYVPRLLD